MQANVGYMDTKKERNKIIIGNMALTQVFHIDQIFLHSVVCALKAPYLISFTAFLD